LVPPAGAGWLDGRIVRTGAAPDGGFLVQDVAAGSDFAAFEDGRALGTALAVRRAERDGTTEYDCSLSDATGRDRAVTLVWTLPLGPGPWRWLDDPDTAVTTRGQSEYAHTRPIGAGSIGRISRYPLAAVSRGRRGVAVAPDLETPALYRAGFAAATGELYLAWDLGLAPEKRSAAVRFRVFTFDAAWGFRAALARLYEVFPEHYRNRVPRQGLWMPFDPISKVGGWEDFGFAFKEGLGEEAWDDAHDILTFRYHEPVTWWMPMPGGVPRTHEAAVAHARALAAKGDERALALFTSGYHDEAGRLAMRVKNAPWCDGVVWSMNSSPGLSGTPTDFSVRWNERIKADLYRPGRPEGEVDGEYTDSAEGYVTAPLNFRREHFAAARTPLAFSRETRRPGLLTLLTVVEDVRELAGEMRARDKYTFANATPDLTCLLAPWLDVMGTEWGRDPPMPAAEMIYRRAVCGTKPYCVLMNEDFTKVSHADVERYMARCLAFGMFPGFFSHNAASETYFSTPALYDRDRPLFKRYVPLVQRVAEAGWRPVTLARSDDPAIRVERWGDRYLTVFNDGSARRTANVMVERPLRLTGRELVRDGRVPVRSGRATVSLVPGGVAVLELADRGSAGGRIKFAHRGSDMTVLRGYDVEESSLTSLPSQVMTQALSDSGSGSVGSERARSGSAQVGGSFTIVRAAAGVCDRLEPDNMHLHVLSRECHADPR
jgi:hypothetical protein